MLTDIFIHTGECATQAGRHCCVPHTVQLTFITHRFAYICVSCNNNNKACLQLSAQCSSCIMCVCVSVCVHVSCIICHAASACCLGCPLTGRLLCCAPRLFKFDFCTQNCCLLLCLSLSLYLPLSLCCPLLVKLYVRHLFLFIGA